MARQSRRTVGGRPVGIPALHHDGGNPPKPLVNGRYVWAPLKGEWRVNTPEELVRQQYVLKLNHRYGFRFEQMDQELRTRHGHSSPRVDIAVWDSVENRNSGKAPVLVVECKSDNVSIDPDDYEQGDSYARAIGEPCEFLVAHNNKETRVFRIIRGLPGQREDIETHPGLDDLSDERRMQEIRRATRVFTRDQFQKLLADCHTILRDNHKLEPGAAFDEISKILFIKMRIERTGDHEKFTVGYLDDARRVFNGDEFAMKGLFDQTRSFYQVDSIFGENDELKISAATFRRIVAKLERFNLGSTADDVKGLAFEAFLGQTFRGDLGQFFTPRPIVDFMVDFANPQEGQVVCDPASGSGGFLIRVFEHIRSAIERDIHDKKIAANKRISSLKISDEERLSRINKAFAELNQQLDISQPETRLANVSRDSICGCDAESRAARTSKMNMIMHGDGHGGIHHHDGLLDFMEIFEGRFDIVLTNPPFGASVKDDQIVGKTPQTSCSVDPSVKRSLERQFGNAFKQSFQRLSQAERNDESILSVFSLGQDQKTVKTEVLFLERCLKLLKPEGLLGIVVPDGVLNNPSLSYLREFIEHQGKLVAVVSIPDKTFRSAKTAVKASILFMTRLSESEYEKREKFRIRREKFYDALNKERLQTLQAIIDVKFRDYRRTASGERIPMPYRKIAELAVDAIGVEANSEQLKQHKRDASVERNEILQKTRDSIRTETLKEFDYEVFMAVAEHVGIKGSGRPDPRNDLPQILGRWRAFQSDPNTVTQDVKQSVFKLNWSQLDRWDPSSFKPIEWTCSPSVLRPLGSALRERDEKVDRAAFEYDELTPITIHFDGSLEARDISDSDEYTMDLYFARPGDIVVSKIDLKNGVVGIVPDSLKNVVVTNHFVVYEPNHDLLYPPYLIRLIQSSFFKDYLWRKKVGSEGRKEVKIPVFESTLIPLPSVPQQKKLVETWCRLEADKADLEARLANEKVRLDNALISCTP